LATIRLNKLKLKVIAENPSRLAIIAFKILIMRNMKRTGVVAVCFAISLSAIGFTLTSGNKPTNVTTVTEQQMTVKPDLAKLKAEIQALESSWAAADNARNAKAIAAFYAEDAISLANNKPMVMGQAAILKEVETDMAKREKASTVTYEVMDVFGNENTVTEVGKATYKDASGKVISTGKYMAVWEKRIGKFVCVRDIYNTDAKEK